MQTPSATRAAAAGALVRRGLRDRLDRQLLDLVAVRVAADARQAGVDDVADARHRQRGLRHVGRQHDAPPARRWAEHALLLVGRQPREQRQDLGARRMVLAQRLGRLADLALARQEDQHVAAARASAHSSTASTIASISVRSSASSRRRPGGSGPRPDTAGRRLRRSAGLRRAKCAREALGIDRGRRDDQLQVRPARQQPLQVAEQKIDVQRRSCASSMISVSYCRQQRSPCVSASRMPSVISLIVASAAACWSVKRTLKPTTSPSGVCSSCGDAARDAASAAIRRGCVWPIRPSIAAAQLEADLRQLRRSCRSRSRRRR